MKFSLLCLLVLLVFVGCSPKGQVTVGPSPEPAPVENKLVDLESIAKAQKDKAGKVIGLDFRNQSFTTDDLKAVEHYEGLKIVRFGGDGESKLTDDDILSFAGLQNVKVLAIDNQPITGDGLGQWPAPEKLVEFYAGSTALDDSVTAALSEMSTLKKLRLSSTEVGDATVFAIAKLQQLEELDLSGCKSLSAASIESIVGLPKLRKLNLYDTPIDDDAIALLRQASSLEWLNLDKTSLTDSGVEKIIGLDKLDFLHLGSTKITDAAAASLAKLTGLSKLIVTRTEMTQAGVDEIKKTLPECEIQLIYVAPK